MQIYQYICRRMLLHNENTAGIYLHIPFCHKACTYCNFHFSTSLALKEPMVAAIIDEMHLRSGYTGSSKISSLYFGGGTPSLLSASELQRLMETLHSLYTVSPQAEITLEANPDDITPANLKYWRNAGINRLSIGIQSFYDRNLIWMNRTHSAADAERCIYLAQDAGFNNITADLIYGLPLLTQIEWESALYKLSSTRIDHISCYALTVEPKTVLQHMVHKGTIRVPDENTTALQFEMAVSLLGSEGFEHYEISNFARNQQYAVHNSSYWTGAKYAGFGPSAHSYNLQSRQWNIANNAKYIEQIQQGSGWYETEVLTVFQQMNERIMLGLRTMWGLDLVRFKDDFGEQNLNILLQSANTWLLKKGLIQVNDHLTIAPSEKFISDAIIADLFFTE